MCDGTIIFFHSALSIAPGLLLAQKPGAFSFGGGLCGPVLLNKPLQIFLSVAHSTS